MKKIFIGIPAYGSKIYAQTTESLLKLQRLVDGIEDVEIEFSFICQESLIPRARNTLVHRFLKSDATHLFFLDADIYFHAEDVINLLNHDKSLIVGAYPLKSLTKKPGLSDQACFDYAINFLRSDNVPVDQNVMEIQYGATGFMMIKRSTIETMIEKYPETRYVNDMKVRDEFGTEMYALFDCIIDPETKRYLSEDYLFCKRWRDIGGQIHLDIGVNLTHIGMKLYDGSLFLKMKETGMLSVE